MVGIQLIWTSVFLLLCTVTQASSQLSVSLNSEENDAASLSFLSSSLNTADNTPAPSESFDQFINLIRVDYASDVTFDPQLTQHSHPRWQLISWSATQPKKGIFERWVYNSGPKAVPFVSVPPMMRHGTRPVLRNFFAPESWIELAWFSNAMDSFKPIRTADRVLNVHVLPLLQPFSDIDVRRIQPIAKPMPPIENMLFSRKSFKSEMQIVYLKVNTSRSIVIDYSAEKQRLRDNDHSNPSKLGLYEFEYDEYGFAIVVRSARSRRSIVTFFLDMLSSPDPGTITASWDDRRQMTVVTDQNDMEIGSIADCDLEIHIRQVQFIDRIAYRMNVDRRRTTTELPHDLIIDSENDTGSEIIQDHHHHQHQSDHSEEGQQGSQEISAHMGDDNDDHSKPEDHSPSSVITLSDLFPNDSPDFSEDDASSSFEVIELDSLDSDLVIPEGDLFAFNLELDSDDEKPATIVVDHSGKIPTNKPSESPVISIIDSEQRISDIFTDASMVRRKKHEFYLGIPLLVMGLVIFGFLLLCLYGIMKQDELEATVDDMMEIDI